ncbi:hypothetical protein DPEC_G00306500 [Dallia pectoralis]|uniref:Uncharacterized protein n=1 Tax=Dallia pectoralis TaxID=75939 RepID=A0ACC2FE91_DALPE|nr:hypothetical protein DPEC_G00306500 [Dallia pectoralis]
MGVEIRGAFSFHAQAMETSCSTGTTIQIRFLPPGVDGDRASFSESQFAQLFPIIPLASLVPSFRSSTLSRNKALIDSERRVEGESGARVSPVIIPYWL